MATSIINGRKCVKINPYKWYCFDGNTTKNVSVPTITGYTCIGYVGVQAGGNIDTVLKTYTLIVKVSTQTMTIANSAGINNADASITVYLLYIRTDLLD